MSNFVVALLAGIGCAGWVYAKALRRTGGLYGRAVAVAGLVGLLAFIAMMIVLLLVDKYVAQ